MTVRLLDAEPTFLEQAGSLIIRKDQHITPAFLDRCKDERFASKAPAGDMHKVASIPTIVVEKWLREGFDVYTAPARDTVSRLKREGLDAFLTTNKRI